MKQHQIIFLVMITTLLSACNMTLAADVTPPPNYIAPTAIPTLGALYPASQPDVANGKIIFDEKCAPCHGVAGLGDGEQGKQLPVSVIPIGLPEIAQQASPAKWYATVTQGNIERFMPPFASLSDQEKWDVVIYAFTLHTTPEQIELGKNLFESNCANCAKQFTHLETMSAISDAELIKQIKDSFGNNFTDEEAFAVAAYIRTLTFAPPAALVVESTPEVETTPETTEQVKVLDEANITGQIENRSGSAFPSNFKVTLRGFQHGADPNAGPQEFLKIEGDINADGTYGFDNELVEGQIYFVEFELNGLNYQTSISIVPADATEITLPTTVIYETTEDFSTLQIDSLEIFFDLAGEELAQIFSVYTFTNASDKTIVIKLEDGQNVPFIAFPNGATGLGFEATQDSAIFVSSADGFAIPPSETPYGLIAFASIPKERKIQISQPAILDINGVTLLLPEGVTADGETLLDNGIQPIQNTNFHVYTASAFVKGTALEFILSGKPKGTDETADILQNQSFLIGIGALGMTLIFAGVWMYLSNKNKEDLEDDEFEDSNSIMDAIIALDDLHKDGKISDQAHRKRRNELKDKLKNN